MQLPEIESVGTYNSQKIGPNHKTTKSRITTMFEIELPIENGGISYIDSNSMPITTDMIICAKPGQKRHTKFPFKCHFIHMSVSDEHLYQTLMNIPDFFKTISKDMYREMFVKLCKYYDANAKCDEIILQSILLELIYTMSKDTQKQAQKNGTNNSFAIVEQALNYINANLTEDLRLENIAKAVSLSPIRFHNIFKSIVGKTPHEYIEEQRIKKAIDLLITTDFTLTEVAFECGFSSQSYFSYAFKRRMKTTPRKYVNHLHEMYGK